MPVRATTVITAEALNPARPDWHQVVSGAESGGTLCGGDGHDRFPPPGCASRDRTSAGTVALPTTAGPANLGTSGSVVCSARVTVRPASRMESSVGRLQSQPTTNRLIPFMRSCERARRVSPERTCSMNRSRPPGRSTRRRPLPEAELRYRLYGAITRAALAAGAPLLLIADDVQWADPQSLGLIHYLMRVSPSARLLVAATARREELDEDHPLTGLTTALQALGRFSEIELGRLGREEAAMLAERVTGAPLDAAGLERLYEDSEGNPLFVVEALQPDAPTAAPKVQAVIAGRLARLSRPAADLAGVAATIGRAFTVDLLAAVTELEEQAFIGALDELWRRGIVRAHGPNSYDFSHGRIRDAAYAALGPPRRRQAHLAAARALERSENAAAATIALHYENAGATTEAIRWHERSAVAAQWLHAHADAVARWSVRYHCPKVSRPGPVRPGSSSGCSPRCPPRWWLSRATRPSG